MNCVPWQLQEQLNTPDLLLGAEEIVLLHLSRLMSALYSLCSSLSLSRFFLLSRSIFILCVCSYSSSSRVSCLFFFYWLNVFFFYGLNVSLSRSLCLSLSLYLPRSLSNSTLPLSSLSLRVHMASTLPRFAANMSYNLIGDYYRAHMKKCELISWATHRANS